MGKAEKYFRQAFLLEQTNPDRLNNLASILINNDRNINEGIELANRALLLTPGSYNFIDTKGWGLYKQGKYKEALDLLQESWNSRMKNAKYDHDSFLHLEAAKKAVANHKNN